MTPPTGLASLLLQPSNGQNAAALFAPNATARIPSQAGLPLMTQLTASASLPGGMEDATTIQALFDPLLQAEMPTISATASANQNPIAAKNVAAYLQQWQASLQPVPLTEDPQLVEALSGFTNGMAPPPIAQPPAQTPPATESLIPPQAFSDDLIKAFQELGELSQALHQLSQQAALTPKNGIPADISILPTLSKETITLLAKVTGTPEATIRKNLQTLKNAVMNGFKTQWNGDSIQIDITATAQAAAAEKEAARIAEQERIKAQQPETEEKAVLIEAFLSDLSVKMEEKPSIEGENHETNGVILPITHADIPATPPPGVIETFAIATGLTAQEAWQMLEQATDGEADSLLDISAFNSTEISRILAHSAAPSTMRIDAAAESSTINPATRLTTGNSLNTAPLTRRPIASVIRHDAGNLPPSSLPEHSPKASVIFEGTAPIAPQATSDLTVNTNTPSLTVNPAANSASAPAFTSFIAQQTAPLADNAQNVSDLVSDRSALDPMAPSTLPESELTERSTQQRELTASGQQQADQRNTAQRGNNLPPAHEQISVQMKQSLINGDSQFTIRLQPHELGNVVVKLEMGGNTEKAARVTIMAETKEALELLQRDSKLLAKALQETGLQLADKDMSFNLEQQPSSQQQGQQDRDPATPNAPHRQEFADFLRADDSQIAQALLDSGEITTQIISNSVAEGLNVRV